MHAPHYRLIDPPAGSLDHLPGAKAVEYHPAWSSRVGQPRAEIVGFIAPAEVEGQWRHWRPSEPPVDRLFRPLAATKHAAVLFLLPPSSFPTLCVRCGQAEPTGDASAYEQPGSHVPYDGELDDHCEDCLEEGQIDLVDLYLEDATSDIVARSLEG